MQTETADMQQHRAAYMFKEAAAKRAIDEVRKLKKGMAATQSCVV